MKKIGIFLGVLFMGLLIFVRSPAPAHADAWTLPFNKIYDVIEMAQTLFSGGKLEFSEIINLTNPLDDVLAVWEDFKDRLSTSATAKRTQDTFNLLADLARSGTTIIDTTTEGAVLPFTFNDAAAFTQFDPMWYVNNFFNPDQIIVNPDPDYLTILNEINNPNDLWLYASNPNPAYPGYYLISPMSNITLANITPDSALNVIHSYFTYNFLLPLQTIRIHNLGDGLYHFDLQPETVPSLQYNSSSVVNIGYFRDNYPNGGLFTNDGRYLNPPLYSKSGSLEDVLKYIRTNFTHVNIMVDGVYWSYLGDIALPPFLGPDVINIGNTDDVTYDVYGLEQPGDLGLDIPNFIDWILNKLHEGATTISLDDAIADEVPLVKTVDGLRAINYEDTRPIERVIEITLDDPDPNPSPTPNPDDPTPPILKLPTFNMIPAPHETTVLSELIDATQKTVPEELINLIWNCFGLLIIGGLIYILHK